ncbi:MAG: PilZ domain-containing protein [Spirochaetales bacterium]|nr:PilZ domain-containing protein [Spirochaetales bacterium]
MALLILYLRSTKIWQFPWIKFFVKGKEAGFNLREINLLRKVAVEGRLKDPTSLFWSIKQIDGSIRNVLLKYKSQGMEKDETANKFIAKLFDFRKRVEFQLPKYKMGLKTTREISNRQRVKITMPGMGPFFSIVVENLRKYFALSYPKGPKLPQGFNWRGQQIGVYFWRTGDAGYFFTTKVVEDFYDRQYPILHVGHTTSVIRTQKRRSVRAVVKRNAGIFPLKNIDEANEVIEQGKGFKAFLMDISEDGSAILIGGKAKLGLCLKMQVELSGSMVVQNGIVKGVNYDEAKNRSILHIQAITPTPFMRNLILTYVYNIFAEQDGEILDKFTPIPEEEEEEPPVTDRL